MSPTSDPGMECSISNTVYLPTELITEILSNLPVKSLLRFRCVSKSWQKLIDSKEFGSLHLNQFPKSNSSCTVILLSHASLHAFDVRHPERCATKLSYPDVEDFKDGYQQLVGSCNGLVCFEGPCYNALYNPATRALKRLPTLRRELECCRRRHYQRRHYKFAYDCVADDYKVLCFTKYRCHQHFHYNRKQQETQLYSMKANSWEIIENPPWKFSHCHSQSVSADNSLHWIENTAMIRSFDLYPRSYDETALPKGIVPSSSKLAVFRGQLHVVTGSFDLWKLNKEGTEKSWSKLHRCSTVHPLETPSSLDVMLSPMPVCGQKEIQAINTKKELDTVICFDLESQVISEIEICGLPLEPQGFYAEAWVESLVPLVD